MKKIVFLAAAIVAAMTACVKEADVDTPMEKPQEEGKIWVEFTAGAETKAALKEGEGNHQIHWENGDEISINGETFVTEDDGAKATFGAKVAATFINVDMYNAIYPASAGTSFDEITVKDSQIATEGGFDDIVAVACSPDNSFQFKHVTSLVKFQIPADFDVKEVTISADEPLAGKVSVTMETEESIPAIEVVNSINKVTLSGDFKTDVNYYVAVLPGEKTNLTVAFNGYTSKVWDKKVTINQGRVANMGTLPHPGVYEISDEAGLFWLAEQVAGGNTFDGKTVVLTDDITMTKSWTPIGNSTDGITKSFRGTFEGQGHTIKDLQVTAPQDAGFFGAKWDGDVKNVNFDGATISGNHYAGVVIGWADGANYNYKYTVSGCEVTNSTVTLSAEKIGEEYDNGDKAGAIVGYAYSIIVSDNTVSNTTITGYRDLGGIVGCAINNTSSTDYTEVINNEIGENVKVSVDNSHNYKNYTKAEDYNVASYCGRVDNKAGGTDNVISGNKGTAEIDTPDFVYLVPNSNWEQGNARFATYFFGTDYIWKDMTDLDGDGIYEVEIPDGGYTTMIFCRMNPNHSDNRWNTDSDTDATKRVWNQTGDMPLDDTKPYCVIPELLI